MKNMEILERLQHWLNCRSIPQVDVIARGTAEFLEDVKSVLNSFDCYDFEETPNSVEDTEIKITREVFFRGEMHIVEL